MRKGGQVTLFVLLAVIVSLMVILYFLFQGGFDSSDSTRNFLVHESIEKCMDDEFIQILSEVGLNGGFPLNEDDGYFYYLGDVNYMSVNVLSEILEDEFMASVSNCLFFVNESYEDVYLRYDDFSIDVDVVSGSVQALVYLDVVVSTNESSSIISFSDNSFVYDSELYEMYKSAMFFADYLVSNSEAVPLSDMLLYAEENDLTFQYSEDGDDLIVVISSNKRYVPEYFVFKNKLIKGFSSEVGFLL